MTHILMFIAGVIATTAFLWITAKIHQKKNWLIMDIYVSRDCFGVLEFITLQVFDKKDFKQKAITYEGISEGKAAYYAVRKVNDAKELKNYLSNES